MGSIEENIRIIQSSIPENVKLVAVSKTKPNEDILKAYQTGQRIFGENKVQDLAAKAEVLPKDIDWHYIGHLQTNKVKYIAPFVGLIHAVDSFKLLKELNKQAAKNNRTINCLLQFHIASEETKFGLSMPQAQELLSNHKTTNLNNTKIIGVMGMASYTNNQKQVQEEFAHLKMIFDELKSTYFKNENSFKEISMGMSGDYQLAIEQGSTMIRVGSSIFGARS